MAPGPLFTSKTTFSNAFCQDPGDNSDPSNSREDSKWRESKQ